MLSFGNSGKFFLPGPAGAGQGWLQLQVRCTPAYQARLKAASNVPPPCLYLIRKRVCIVKNQFHPSAMILYV